MGISYFKRIKRPNDQANPPPQCFLALIEFQRPPNSTVAIIPVHTCHVRMKKHSPVNKSHERQRVSDQPFRVERSKNLPARFLRHHEQRCRLDFEVLFAPNLSLQRNAALKFFNTLTFSNDDPLAHQTLRASIDFRESLFSARFAVSQNSSICSRGTSASAFPLFTQFVEHAFDIVPIKSNPRRPPR